VVYQKRLYILTNQSDVPFFVLHNFNISLHTFFSLQELIEKLNKRELPQSEYPCMNEPSPAAPAATSNGGSGRTTQVPSTQTSSAPAHSMRSRRTANWAKTRSDDGTSRYKGSNYSFKGNRNTFNFLAQTGFMFIHVRFLVAIQSN